MIQIVPFTSQHAEGVGALIVGIQRDEFQIPITLEDQPDLQDIPAFYQQGAGNFWVAVSEGEVVGTVALLDLGNHQGALRKMFVHASLSGARTRRFRAPARHPARVVPRAGCERGLPRHNREVPRRPSLLRAERLSADRRHRTAADLSENGGGHQILSSRAVSN